MPNYTQVPSQKSFIVKLARRSVTFALVSVAWIVFRANSIGDLFILVKKLFTFTGAGIGGTLDIMGLDAISIPMIIASVAVMLIMDNLISYEGRDGSHAVVKSGAAFYYVWVIALVWLLIASRDAASSFI